MNGRQRTILFTGLIVGGIMAVVGIVGGWSYSTPVREIRTTVTETIYKETQIEPVEVYVGPSGPERSLEEWLEMTATVDAQDTVSGWWNQWDTISMVNPSHSIRWWPDSMHIRTHKIN